MGYWFWFYDRIYSTDIIECYNFDASVVVCPNNGNVWYVPGTVEC